MKKKLFLNTISSIIQQIVVLLCGLILPRLILETFGSEVNGLISSITHFLALITFLDLGVGSVIQSSFYSPLLHKDNNKISAIFVSGKKYFSKIAFALVLYIIVLSFIYPLFGNQSFGYYYISGMVLVLSTGSLFQYYFGLIDSKLIYADQKGYIYNFLQILTLLINTILSYFLIKLQVGIHAIKLITSLVFLLRPLILRVYINKYYKINRKIHISEEVIPQKMHGVSQHIASVVLSNTDVVVLTFFSSLSSVSIYSVYFMIINGLNNLVYSFTSGIQPIFGRLWAQNDHKKLNDFFNLSEFIIHFIVNIIYICCLVLIIPFITVYTFGINDIEYIQPLFGVLIVLSYTVYSLRIPYHNMIVAAGQFRNTQKYYIISAIINLFLSIIGVIYWGLIGVSIGTLVAMLYQTISLAIYNSKNITKSSTKLFLKQCLNNILCFIIVYFSTRFINLTSIDYISWLVMAFKVSTIAFAEILIISSIFYWKQLKFIFSLFSNRLSKLEK